MVSTRRIATHFKHLSSVTKLFRVAQGLFSADLNPTTAPTKACRKKFTANPLNDSPLYEICNG